MKVETRKLEIEMQKFKFGEDDDIPVFGICAFNRKRMCSFDCTALSIMAIPRTRLVMDSQIGQYTLVADREPVVGPFCRRGNFPIGIHADEKTVGKMKENGADVSFG